MRRLVSAFMSPKSFARSARYTLLANGVLGRILRALVVNVSGIGITLLVQVVSVPILLGAWGVRVYGEWLILSAIPSYVALSDLGVSPVAANSMVMLEASGRHEEAVVLGRRLWSVVTMTTGASAVVAIIIALILVEVVGGESALSAPEMRIVLAALFTQVAIVSQYGVVDAWYRTAGRYAQGAALRHIGRLLEFGAVIIAVILGARPGVAAVVLLAVSMVVFTVSWLVLRGTVPWATFRPVRPDRQAVRELLPSGLAYSAFPIGNALSLQGFTIAIGSTLGPVAVVMFSTTRTVTRLALQGMASINNSVWVELSRSIGTGQLDLAREIVRRSVQLSLIVSCVLIVGLALFGVRLIGWWTDGVVAPPRSLLLLLLLVIAANSTWFTVGAVLVATNRHHRFAIVYILGTIASLIGVVPLSSMFGLPGAAVALFALDIAMIGYIIPASLRVIRDTPSSFVHALLDVRGVARSISRLR